MKSQRFTHIFFLSPQFYYFRCSFLNYHLHTVVSKLVFSANLKRQDTPLLNISDPFLAETVEYWSTLNYREDYLNFPSSQI